MTTSQHTLDTPASHARKKTNGGYLFLPRRLSRGAFLKWLRRTHAWLGLWGAALGLLFGFTGILLNHRDILKIPIGRMRQTEIQLALPEPRPADARAMAVWLGQSLRIDTARARIKQEPAKEVIWQNQTLQQPASWNITLRSPSRLLSAEYWEGNAFVSVKQGNANLLQTLNNLHMGTGMGMGWVLLVDTLAGALLLLSMTGILLWTRLHGPRLAAAGLGLGSLSLSLFFALTAING
ncbi:PepSY-associated TM helix domain-containing protein [Methylomonas sp. SURF-2]|uniref:PepSY-associated TM helix domain-containing protein n=1 Tax=Methylomonas subterranea TaxID=2952225 RepID=A0ABT1TIZ1_9GAMM|nr:PepSY-associated TM helix domain-containing protein [Methylomonas sp. SURF-2]MCQ8105441.1 PepSY-associated TM helix domain-containing protein [Methylomonas sp. SURF-2]